MKKTNFIAVAIIAVIITIVTVYLTQNPTQTSAQPTTKSANVDKILWVKDHSPIIGPIDAPVTLVEFIDPACEACRAMYPYVKEIMKKHPNDVRLVLRYVNFHTQSVDAIRILEAARKQDQFNNVLEVLLAFQPAWAPHGREAVDPWEFVAKTPLNIEQAKQDAADPSIAEIIKLDMQDVEAAGVKRTPSFFVNNKPLTVMHPDVLLEMIETELNSIKPKEK